jgi:hypothetical protein
MVLKPCWHYNEKTTNFTIILPILIIHLRIPILRPSAAESMSKTHLEIAVHGKGAQTQFFKGDLR